MGLESSDVVTLDLGLNGLFTRNIEVLAYPGALVCHIFSHFTKNKLQGLQQFRHFPITYSQTK